MAGVAGQVGQERVQADQVRADLLPVLRREQLPGDQGLFMCGQQAWLGGMAERGLGGSGEPDRGDVAV
jgi:hypothetical protein